MAPRTLMTPEDVDRVLEEEDRTIAYKDRRPRLPHIARRNCDLTHHDCPVNFSVEGMTIDWAWGQ